MRTDIAMSGGLKGSALAGVAALALLASAAMAQAPGPPQGRPPGAPPGPPPGLAGLGGPGDARNGNGPPPGPPLTPAEELVKSLTPPMAGGLIPTPPVSPDAEKPSPDPRNFEGTWYHNQALVFRTQKDMYDTVLPYTMAGAKVLERRVKSLADGAPFVNASAKCRPPGLQWQRDLNFPFQIFQSQDWIEVVFEEYHGRWKIVLDPSKAPAPAQKEYMGYSVGHWEGNTLVVETRDFKQALWLDVDGTPMSANGKVIERIRKVDNGDGKPFLELVTTVNDPTYYYRPWSMVRTFGWHPGIVLFKEYNCEEQMGDPSGGPDAGLVPEPKD